MPQWLLRLLLINDLEIGFGIAALLLIFLYALFLFRSWRTALVMAVLAAPAVYLAILFTSQFISIDEIERMDETTEIRSVDLVGWRMHGYRTTYGFFGPVIRVWQRFTADVPHIRFQGSIKLVHWMQGLALIGWIHYLIHRHFVEPARQKTYFMLYLYIILLLPSNLVALKVFNYDLLSMLFGVIGTLYIALALKYERWRYALLAVITGYLAAQEKVIAAPVLLMAIAVFALISTRKRTYRSGWHEAAAVIGWTAAGILIAVSVGAFSYAAVWVVRRAPLDIPFFDSIVYPLIKWAEVIFWFTLQVPWEQGFGFTGIKIGMTVVLLSALVGGLMLVGRWFEGQPDWQTRAARLAYRADLILLLIVIAAGLPALLFVTKYQAPFAPIQEGAYVPPAYNTGILHYGARTAIGHKLASLGTAYSVVLNGFPTIVWVSMIAGMAISARTRLPERMLIPNVLMLIGLATPMGFAALDIITGLRYLNLWFYLIAIAGSLYLIEALSSLSVSRQRLAVGGLATLIVLELLPFGPIFGPFRPVWDWPAQGTTPVQGVIEGVWPGWGDEAAIAATLLEYHCTHPGSETAQNVECGALNVYVRYPGFWLADGQYVTTYYRPQVHEDDPPRTAGDLLLINRRSFQRAVPFPEDVEPVLTIRFLGITQAWLFRMDQLEQTGYLDRLIAVQEAGN